MGRHKREISKEELNQEPLQRMDKSKNQKENINSDCLGNLLSLIPQIAPHPLNGFQQSKSEYIKGIVQNIVLKPTGGFSHQMWTTIKVC